MKHNSNNIKDNNKKSSFAGNILSVTTTTKLDLEEVMALLIKDKNKLSRQDVKEIGKYLCDNFNFFRNMKDNSETGVFDRMVSVLNYEFYSEDINIINFGEIGDKAYVLLKGKVGVYKPRDVNKQMIFEDFEAYLNYIKLFEGNTAKYKRIIHKNDHIDLFSQFAARQRIYNCIIEEEDLLGTFEQGFHFGDIALLKRAPRNATVRSLSKSHFVSIDQYNYNEILRVFEEKRLEKELEAFKNTYQLFKPWSHNNLLNLFNCFQRISLLQGDYLYKQNDDSDCIYIIESGEFEVYSIVNFEWVNDFIKYIMYSESNIVNTLRHLKGNKSENELKTIYNNSKTEKEAELGPSPCQATPIDFLATIRLSQYPKQDNLIEIKLNEDKLSKKSFKVKIRKVDQREVLGYEDGIELKNRYTTVRCMSRESVVRRVRLFDLYCLLYNLKEADRSLFTKAISIRKLFIINLIQNASKIKARIIEDRFSEKYLEIIQSQNVDDPTKRLAMKFGKGNNGLKDFLSLKRAKSMNLVMPKAKGKKNILINTQMKLFPTFVPNKHYNDNRYVPPDTEKTMRKNMSFLSTPFGAYYINFQNSKQTENYSNEKASTNVNINRKNEKSNSSNKEIENTKTQSIINWKNQSIVLSSLSPQSLKQTSLTTREITKINPFRSSCFSLKKKNVFTVSKKELIICKNIMTNLRASNVK